MGSEHLNAQYVSGVVIGSYRDKPGLYTSFSLENSGTSFVGIKFDVPQTHDADLEGKMWDKIRESAERYFSGRSRRFPGEKSD